MRRMTIQFALFHSIKHDKLRADLHQIILPFISNNITTLN